MWGRAPGPPDSQLFFNSNALAGLGFVEEILPFTDVIPTFTISWCLATLWPTTPLARKLLPQPAPATASGGGGGGGGDAIDVETSQEER